VRGELLILAESADSPDTDDR